MKPVGSHAGSQIIIVGSENLQNDLLSYALGKELGSPCWIVEDTQNLSERLDRLAESRLLLVECNGQSIESTLKGLHQQDWYSEVPVILSAFNAQRGQGIEESAMPYGVRGIFYHDDKLQQVLKGVKMLFRGEMWVSRSILAEFAEASSKQKLPVVQDDHGLTFREKEILALVSIGSTNGSIAAKLFLSPHTVKTHLYHIFKKINVPSRLQAALWAIEHL
jgi:DNA-binding NarL/FixJ family response regulator